MREYSLAARIIAVGALALIAQACGGKELTTTELVTQANAICKEANDIRLPGATSLQDVADRGPTALRLSEELLGRFRRLKPSSADAPAFEQFLAAYDAFLKAFQEIIRAAQAHDQAAFDTAATELADVVSTELTAAANNAGLSVCAGS